MIVLTTTDDNREIQRCYDLGANVYIIKPVNYESFANAIRQLGLFLSVMQVPETRRPCPSRSASSTSMTMSALVGWCSAPCPVTASPWTGLPAVRGGAGPAAGRFQCDRARPRPRRTRSGLEVLAKIRAEPAPPPVIYVTGSDDARVAVAALKAGAVDYVWKDVQGHYRDLLIESIRSALAQEKLRRDKEQADREIREARDRAELLLSEVNHRVANSLALVSSLAGLQAKGVADESARLALHEMQARIAAIAGVHRRLYTSPDVRSVDMAIYLESLVRELGAAIEGSADTHAADARRRQGASARPGQGRRCRRHGDRAGDERLQIRLSRLAAGEIRVGLRRCAEGGRTDHRGRRRRLFRRRRRPGLGLGMRIVKAMAGNLRSEVRFDPSKGARASVAFALEGH